MLSRGIHKLIANTGIGVLVGDELRLRPLSALKGAVSASSGPQTGKCYDEYGLGQYERQYNQTDPEHILARVDFHYFLI